jgi:hypothetical protein
MANTQEQKRLEDMKKSLLNQVQDLIKKGEVPEVMGRTLVAKIDLAEPRFLELLLNKFGEIRKSMTEEAEALKKSVPEGTK